MFFEVTRPDTRMWWVETDKYVERYDALERAQEIAFNVKSLYINLYIFHKKKKKNKKQKQKT